MLMAVTYVGSGLMIRIGGVIRRRFKRSTTPAAQHQIS
jgi:hypothetical protein